MMQQPFCHKGTHIGNSDDERTITQFKNWSKRALFLYSNNSLFLLEAHSICKKFNIKQEMSRVPFTGQETKMWQ